MLETDGIPPRLNNQVCEEILCQQYYYRGQLQQDVDVLLLKVNGRWHQLYFDEGVVFWRLQEHEPEAVEAQTNDPMSYPIIDVGEKFALKQSVISDYVTEPFLGGARVSFVFEDKGTLIVLHKSNKTSLRYLSNRFGV